MSNQLPNPESNLYGPNLYSWYLHVDPTPQDARAWPRQTILQVQGWSATSGVSVHRYSLNGSTNNSVDFVDPVIPSVVQGSIKLDVFWSMVESGQLVLLEPRPYRIEQAVGILATGDRVGENPSYTASDS